jgi:hypothetical protein
MPLGSSQGDQLVTIPSSQRRLHIASERAAIWIAVPALAWVALNPKVPQAARNIAGAVALATLLIDGYLLKRWHDA